MFAFTEEQIYALQARPTNIRNISMIAQVDHGKSTLMDAIVPEAFMVTQSRKGKMPREWFQQDEEERIKQTAFPLYFKTNSEELSAIEQRTDGSEFLINLIDFPYHADLSSEVATALRVTDGALVVIDCVEGFGMQTETVLRQALMERVKPVLVINKVDHPLLNHRISKEDLFQSFSQAIESFNAIVSTYPDPALGDIQVHPEKARSPSDLAFTVGLSLSPEVWCRQGEDDEKTLGDNYFDSITKKWTTKATSADGKPLERAFNMFVLEPIFKILDAVMDHKKENIRTILEKLSIDLTLDEYDLEGRSLLKVVMRKFLPAREALLEMIVFHLPSPVTAQRYRVETLYEGPMDDESAVGIRNCDPKGPLIIYVSKMVPVTTTGGYSNERRAGYTKQFYALGRVFSGSVKSGLKIRILGPNYVHGKKEDLFIKSIQRIVLMTGRYVEPIEECLAGNIIGLAGIDQFLLTSGTITSSETAHNIKVMKFSTSPVVQIAVDVKSVADLPKLIEGLRRLSKSDPCVQTWIGGTGEHIVAGTSEAHLEICLKDLEEDHAGVPMKKSDPGVSYRETVRAESSMTALSKSQNLHNRLYVKALPIGEEATLAIETGKFRAHDDFNVRARILADEFGWDIADARKIWTFSPDATGPNVFVDLTKGVQHLNEIKDSCVAAFKWITRESVCAEENMRGIRFNLLDVTMSGDAISRGDGQIMAPCRRVCNAACLLADPTLLEPIYLVEIQCPINVISSVHSVLNNRRGQVLSEEQRPGVPMLTVKAYLPVVEAFGFTTDLQSHTQGQAFAHCVFDHWESIPGSVFDKGSKVEEVVRGIRIRKGLQPDIPSLDKYYDKL